MENVEQAVRTGEWLTILAALLGPILAVQAQKWVERSRARTDAKERVFRSLMATRAARLSSEHVQALNMITIAFYGSRIFGVRLQTKTEKAVSTAWRAYFDTLAADTDELSENQKEMRFADRDEKFIAMLAAIAAEQGFEFDTVELKRSTYSPLHHGTMEAEAEMIRTGLAKVLSNERAIPMYVVNLPGTQSTE